NDSEAAEHVRAEELPDRERVAAVVRENAPERDFDEPEHADREAGRDDGSPVGMTVDRDAEQDEREEQERERARSQGQDREEREPREPPPLQRPDREQRQRRAERERERRGQDDAGPGDRESPARPE